MPNDMRYWMTLAEGRPNRAFENQSIVTYHGDRLVFHTTNEKAAIAIRKHGFRTGKELDLNERRAAIYFADADVNPGVYARNAEGERFHGQQAATIGVT